MNFFKDIPTNLRPNVKATPIEAKVCTIPPETAKWLLDNRNGRNRDQSAPLVKSIIASIVNDKWEVTGQPIIFDTNGNILDGQHRLRACQAAQKPIDVLVVTNVNPDVFPLLDTGKTRTVADVFKAAEINNSRYASAVVSKVLALRQNYSPFTSEGNQNTTRSKNGCRPQLCLDEYRTHSDLYSSIVDWVVNLYQLQTQSYKGAISRLGVSLADLGSTVFYLHHDLGYELPTVKRFIEELVDPAISSTLMISLRGFLIDDNDPRNTNRMRPKQFKNCIIKAWELFVTGATSTRFNFQEVRDLGTPLSFKSATELQVKVA